MAVVVETGGRIVLVEAGAQLIDIGRVLAFQDQRDPLSIRAVTFWYPFVNPDNAARLAEGLRKAGVPD